MKNSLFCVVGCILFCNVVRAQDYQWRCPLPFVTYAVAFNPLSVGKVIFTSTPESPYIARSNDGGVTWQYSEALDVPSPDIHQILCVPSDTNVVLAVSSQSGKSTGELYRSTDGGLTWNPIPDLGGIDGEDIDFYPPTDALYYGENFGGLIYQSSDHGATWVQTGQQNSNVTLCSMGVSQDSSPLLLAGSENGVLDRSTNLGVSWTVVIPADTVKTPEVPKVVFSNWSPDIAFATRWHSTNNSLVKSMDGGRTWATLNSPDPSVWAFEPDQRRRSQTSNGPTHLWTGEFLQATPDTSANGLVQESTDGGSSWQSTGFPRLHSPSVWMIKFDTTSGTIAVATDSGLFIGHEPKSSVGSVPEDSKAVSIYPNPAGSTVTYGLPYGIYPKGLQIFSISGEIICREILKPFSSNRVDLSAYSSGEYFVEITDESGHRWIAQIVHMKD